LFGVGYIEDYAKRERQDVVLSAFDILNDANNAPHKPNPKVKLSFINAPAFANLTYALLTPAQNTANDLTN
jgi:hypothetical protein